MLHHNQVDKARLQVLPGIAFALDLIEVTGQTGVQEVLLATVSFGIAISQMQFNLINDTVPCDETALVHCGWRCRILGCAAFVDLRSNRAYYRIQQDNIRHLCQERIRRA